MPRCLRYTFPTVEPFDVPSPEHRARAMAAVFLAIPEEQLRPGRLESADVFLVDRGGTDYVHGDPMGEELAPWLRLVVGPGGRRAFLDVDVEAMAHVQVEAERRRRGDVLDPAGRARLP